MSPRGEIDDDVPAVPEPRVRCDHICLLDDGHVDRGEPHFYGYEIPSPRRSAAPTPGEENG
jgi:hypothetical protein